VPLQRQICGSNGDKRISANFEGHQVFAARSVLGKDSHELMIAEQ